MLYRQHTCGSSAGFQLLSWKVGQTQKYDNGGNDDSTDDVVQDVVCEAQVHRQIYFRILIQKSFKFYYISLEALKAL